MRDYRPRPAPADYYELAHILRPITIAPNIKPLAMLADATDFSPIATNGRRGVSGPFLREIFIARCILADRNAETFMGAQHLAMRLDRDRAHVSRADAVLREHGWLHEIRPHRRAKLYRVQEGVTQLTHSCPELSSRTTLNTLMEANNNSCQEGGCPCRF